MFAKVLPLPVRFCRLVALCQHLWFFSRFWRYIIFYVCVYGGDEHWLVRMEWRPAGLSVYLPLLIFPCTTKSRSSLLAPAHLGGPTKMAVKRLWWWWLCVFVYMYVKTSTTEQWKHHALFASFLCLPEVCWGKYIYLSLDWLSVATSPVLLLYLHHLNKFSYYSTSGYWCWTAGIKGATPLVRNLVVEEEWWSQANG